MQPLIAGNWKMHGTALQLGDIAGAFTGDLSAKTLKDAGATCSSSDPQSDANTTARLIRWWQPRPSPRGAPVMQ
jgi:hypothetical protein